MTTIAEQNRQDTELMYVLLSEGKLDLMYLPAGVIAWLWDRPKEQVEAARDLAVALKDICPITDGSVLRSDQNILVLKCEDGRKFNVYPSGGYGSDGEAMDLTGCLMVIDDVAEPLKDCPMEGGDQLDYGRFMTTDELASTTARELRQDLAPDPSPDGPMVDIDGPLPSDLGEDLADEEHHDSNEEFIKAMAPDEMRDVLQKVLRDVQLSASSHKSGNFRALRAFKKFTSREGKQKIINDWVKAGAPLPIIDGFNNTQAGPYKHEGERFMAWEKEYLLDTDEENAKTSAMKNMRAPEAWKKYTDYMMRDDYDDSLEENTGTGGGGFAGEIGTDMFGYEDEIPELEAMVETELNKYGVAPRQIQVNIELEDEKTAEYLPDVPVLVAMKDGVVEGVFLADDLEFRGKHYRAGSKFPDWLMSSLPFNVKARRSDGEGLRGLFHSWLADKVESSQ